MNRPPLWALTLIEIVVVLGLNLILWLLIAPAYIRWAVQLP